ncbi:MAG: aspartate kinase [Myxococcota bacterium]
MKQNILIMKFGGSSLSDPGKIKNIASLVAKRFEEGKKVVVVVSAQGKTTLNLMKSAREISPNLHKRELDMVLTAGERVSMALLAMAINDLGLESISFTGSQCGIITTDEHSNARIIDVRPFRVQDELNRNKIVIVAGFQGVSYKREITTLGRGGSDTTAIALTAALDAEYCEIFSDVDGIYSGDPREVDPFKLTTLSYDEMLELAFRGAKVLNHRAVAYAKDKKIAIYARSSLKEGSTTIRKFKPEYQNAIYAVTRHPSLVMVTAKSAETFLELMEKVQNNDLTIKYLVSAENMFKIFISYQFLPELTNIKTIFSENLEVESISLLGNSIAESIDIILKSEKIIIKNNLKVHAMEFSHSHLTYYISGSKGKNLEKLFHQQFIKPHQNPV